MSYKQISIITKRWKNQKPSLGSQVNWGHPISRGLVGCWLMNEGGGRKLKNSVTSTPLAWGTWPGGFWNVGKKGVEFKITGSRSYTLSEAGRVDDYFSKLTAVSLCRIADNAAGRFTIAKWHGGNNQRVFRLGSGSSVGTWGMWTWDGLANVVAETTTNFDTTAYHLIAGSIDGTNVNLYVDGVLRQQTAFASSAPSPTPVVTIFSDAQATGDWLGSCVLVYYFNRALSPQEIQQLYIEPYCFIQPIRRRFYFQVSEGGIAVKPGQLSRIKQISNIRTLTF